MIDIHVPRVSQSFINNVYTEEIMVQRKPSWVIQCFSSRGSSYLSWSSTYIVFDFENIGKQHMGDLLYKHGSSIFIFPLWFIHIFRFALDVTHIPIKKNKITFERQCLYPIVYTIRLLLAQILSAVIMLK